MLNKKKKKKSPSDCHNYFQIFIVLLLKDFLRKFTSLEELKEVKVVFIYIYIYMLNNQKESASTITIFF